MTSCLIERDRTTREDRERTEVAAAAVAERAVDLRVLRAVAARPALATSITSIRQVAGLKRDLVYMSVGRLLSRGWLTMPEKQRQPYALSEAGRDLFSGDSTVPGGESSPLVPSRPQVVPGTAHEQSSPSHPQGGTGRLERGRLAIARSSSPRLSRLCPACRARERAASRRQP